MCEIIDILIFFSWLSWWSWGANIPVLLLPCWGFVWLSLFCRVWDDAVGLQQWWNSNIPAFLHTTRVCTGNDLVKSQELITLGHHLHKALEDQLLMWKSTWSLQFQSNSIWSGNNSEPGFCLWDHCSAKSKASAEVKWEIFHIYIFSS